MTALSEQFIAAAFAAAARAELAALKPGNVHVHAAGHGMVVDQFEAAAEASAPFISNRLLPVGRRVEGAVQASMAATGCNTNLGILLLCAPLARAIDLIDTAQPQASLRDGLVSVLNGLDSEDAAAIYSAIRTANPGGLGSTSAADVAEPPTLPILEAMRLAAERDRIALNYGNAFADIFELALPALRHARRHSDSPDLAVTTLHMILLATITDTHIRRKFGEETAEGVKQEAISHRALWLPVVRAETLPPLARFDADLKARGINPGTTADFVVATLFAEALEDQIASTRATLDPCLK